MTQIGSVSLRGLYDEDAAVTVLLSGSPTTADVGKAASQDTNANATFKLAADGDPIQGAIGSVEARTGEGVTVGTLLPKGSFEFAVKASATVALGDCVCGGGSGTVRTLVPTTSVFSSSNVGGLTVNQLSSLGTNIVVEKRTVSAVDYVTVLLK